MVYNFVVYLFWRGVTMAVCYNKLWKLLIDRKLKKKDLLALSGISRGTLTKLNKDENVSTETLVRICTALKCDIADIVEVTDINK
jgi:DNA-binding Xre family transcriptional regulator